MSESWSNPADAAVGFDLEVADFGVLKAGEVLSFQNGFTNLGVDSLQIEIVSACDCMDVTWTTESLPPQTRGAIEILFDSSGLVGDISKDIDVIFKNTDNRGYPLVKRFVLKGRIESP